MVLRRIGLVAVAEDVGVRLAGNERPCLLHGSVEIELRREDGADAALLHPFEQRWEPARFHQHIGIQQANDIGTSPSYCLVRRRSEADVLLVPDNGYVWVV